jgi:hypothetical protein
MVMQGIYINKDSLCAFFKERKLKKTGKEYCRHLEVTLTNIRDKMQ